MFRFTMSMLRFAAIAALLTGCISVYRPDVAQGNIVTPEMVKQLRLGMTRSQVRFVLGSPLVTDQFHPDRWDYYYSLHRTKDDTVDTRLLTVFFKGDELLKIEGDIEAKPPVR